MIKKRRINTATIGLGFGLTHAKIFMKNKLTNLINISDINTNKKKYEKILKTKFLKNENLIFENKDINLVSIASYDNCHFHQILKAIKFRKDIFVEKPMCQSLVQLREIKRLLKKYKLNLSSNFVLRYHPKFKKVKDLLKKDVIGKIYSIEGEYNYGRLEKIIKGWRGKMPYFSVVQGGGIHIIDLMNWFTNSFPIKAISTGNKIVTRNTSFKYNDNNIALIKFKNKVIGKVSSNFSCVLPHEHFFKIFGSKGTLVIGKNYISLYKDNKKNTKPKKIKYRFKKNYKEKLLENYIKLLKDNKKIVNPSMSCIFKSMATCFAIDKSIKTKKWESIKV